MARFLFSSWHFPGHYYPLVPIAKALLARGHDVAFLASPEAVRVLELQGIRCFPFQALDTEAVDQFMFSEERGSWLGIRDAFRLRTALRRWLVDTLQDQVADLENVLDQWPADVVATDPTFWGPIVILREKRTIPVAIASFVPAFMPATPEVPLYGPGLPPVRSPWTRLVAGSAAGLGALLSREVRQAVDLHRANHGLPPLGMSVTQYTATLPLYLMPCTPDFDYHRTKLPSTAKYVGPYVWNRPGGSPSPSRLSDLDHHQPWVHVTEGTVHIREPFLLKAAVQGLGDQPWAVILTSGKNRDPRTLPFSALPPNVHLFDYIPHSELLPHLNVLVTTGGAGTTLAALQAGVPLVMVPTEMDKPENAGRVVEAGAGIRLAPSRCTPRRLRAAVEQVLGDSTFRDNARRLQASFSSCGGADTAADHLEAMAARETDRTAP